MLDTSKTKLKSRSGKRKACATVGAIFKRSIEHCHCHTIENTEGTFGEGIYHECSSCPLTIVVKSLKSVKVACCDEMCEAMNRQIFWFACVSHVVWQSGRAPNQ